MVKGLNPMHHDPSASLTVLEKLKITGVGRVTKLNGLIV